MHVDSVTVINKYLRIQGQQISEDGGKICWTLFCVNDMELVVYLMVSTKN